MSSNIVPTDQDSIYLGLDALSTLERNSIIRPANPPPGIAGFLFDIPLEDAVELASDITDNFVEDNTTIQDQIGLKPEIVTVHGMIGELVLTQDQIDNNDKQPNPLPLNPDLEPEYTEIQTVEIKDGVTTATDEITSQTSSQSLYDYFSSQAAVSNSKQSKAFAYFYQLWKGRQLFTIDTPWGFFTSMAIQSLRATQDATTKFASDFTIVFKKIRFAQEVTISSGQLAGRCAFQSTPETNNGGAGKEPVNQSWLKQLLQ